MNLIPETKDLLAILPALVMSGGGLALLIMQFAFRKGETKFIQFFTLLILMATLYLTVDTGFNHPGFGNYFNHQITLSKTASWLNLIYLITAILTIIAAPGVLQKHKVTFPEFYPLMLFATTGMYFMTSASDLILIFVGLEVLSISLYIMIGMARTEVTSLEASMKYFLLGAFSSGFMLMGIAFLYGGSGSTLIATALQPIANGTASTYSKIGLGLFLVGISFKVALAPFHSWTPDVYEGALTSITGFMASGPKAAAMGLMLITFQYINPSDITIRWSILLGAIALFSMTVGNVLALKQNNLKRVLAYSSISHAGYVVAGVACGANMEVVYYLLMYSFMNIAGFGIIAYLENGERQISYNSLRLLVKTNPWTAFGLLAIFFSLGGIPPLIGFWSKLFLLQKIAESDHILNRVLLIGGVVNSAIAIYYYLRVTVNAFMIEEEGDIARGISLPKNTGITIASGVCFFFILISWMFFSPGSL